jgi:hypothetical protein
VYGDANQHGQLCNKTRDDCKSPAGLNEQAQRSCYHEVIDHLHAKVFIDRMTDLTSLSFGKEHHRYSSESDEEEEEEEEE